MSGGEHLYLRAMLQSMLGGSTSVEEDALLGEVARRFVLNGITISNTGVISMTVGSFDVSVLTGTLPVTKGGTGLATVAANRLLYVSALNTIADLATANNAVLVTSAGGVPSLSATLPSGLTITAPVLSGSVTGVYTLAGTPTITAPAISAPVFSGSATGTYTLAGTPTITAPAISAPVLSGSVTGTYTLAGTPTITAPAISAPVFSGSIGSDLLFTDALFDIGKTGATRPRDLFISRNAVAGGTLAVTGVQTLTGATTMTAGFTANANSTINGTGSAATNLTISTATTGSAGFSLSNATTGILAQFLSTNAKDFAINVNAGNTFGLEISSAGIWRGRAYGAGTATFDASGNISSASDERLKDRIAPFPHGLSEVLALRPVQHGWNAQSGLERDHLYAGFVAQDVEPVMPIAVGQNADGIYSLSDRALIAALVNAVKTLTARIETLEGQSRA